MDELRKNLTLTTKLHGTSIPKTQAQINAENQLKIENLTSKLDLVIEKLETIVAM
jgi:hypothetical protein